MSLINHSSHLWELNQLKSDKEPIRIKIRLKIFTGKAGLIYFEPKNETFKSLTCPSHCRWTSSV